MMREAHMIYATKRAWALDAAYEAKEEVADGRAGCAIRWPGR
jgi:hypothetical protein